MMSWNPGGVDVRGVDEVEAAVHEGVEDLEGGGRVCGPAEDVAAKHERNDLKAGSAEGFGLHCALQSLGWWRREKDAGVVR